MAKAVADINDPDEKQGGFASGDSDITGFSHMHDSGTGGVRKDLSRIRGKVNYVTSHLHSETFLSSHKVGALETS